MLQILRYLGKSHFFVYSEMSTNGRFFVCLQKNERMPIM